MAKTEHRRLCGTAKSRLQMADKVAEVARAQGAVVSVSAPALMPRGLRVHCAIGDYRVALEFDGDSHVGVFLPHWYAELGTVACYPSTFGINCRGSVNTFHYGKAITCVDTFAELLQAIDDGLGRLASEAAP